VPRRARAIIRTAAAILILLAAAARPARAQSSGFLSRADYYLLWSGLASADPRFSWNGRVGLETDLADYGTGRLTLKADYEAFLGSERRRWDLNQGAYRFELALSRRIGTAEISGGLLHVSRHVVDRENPPSISWNTLGVRARDRLEFHGGATSVDGRIEIARAMQQARVDYAWTSDAGVSVRHTLQSQPRVALLADASGGVVGTKREMFGRPRVCGGRIEGGVRVNGNRAALEMFVGYERRIDAYPTDRFRVRMWMVGFRIVSR
jgi:hypothetical protein